jgi:hypothetical protein
MLDGIAVSQPQPKIPPELIKFLGKTFNAWQVCRTEQQLGQALHRQIKQLVQLGCLLQIQVHQVVVLHAECLCHEARGNDNEQQHCHQTICPPTSFQIATPLLESHVVMFPDDSRCFQALVELYKLVSAECYVNKRHRGWSLYRYARVNTTG